jgi:hypothetical protein
MYRALYVKTNGEFHLAGIYPTSDIGNKIYDITIDELLSEYNLTIGKLYNTLEEIPLVEAYEQP